MSKVQPGNDEYQRFLVELKTRIARARQQAYGSVNRQLISLYWEIGSDIVDRQERLGWGKAVVEQLSQDLRREMPDSKGFSAKNLWYMRKFYLSYRDDPILQQLVGEIPWSSNLIIMTRVSDPVEREYYLRSTAELGWSRNVLIHQIEAGAFARHRSISKQHNFEKELPEHLAEQADLALKESYALEFLGLGRTALEREVEKQMVARIRDVLLELGGDFAFIGSQYPVRLEETEYFIDLLFFHRGLCCLVAVELKATDFQPEHAGKMSFYLSVLDDIVRREHENPSIGIILCKSRDRVLVEYALRSVSKPMGVARYSLTKALPAHLSEKLPSVEELEAKLQEGH